MPHTDLSDRQIILRAIDYCSGMALRERRDELKQGRDFYSKAFDHGSCLANMIVAAELAVEIGIASNTYRSAERLKHFREWGGRVRRTTSNQNSNGPSVVAQDAPVKGETSGTTDHPAESGEPEKYTAPVFAGAVSSGGTLKRELQAAT